MKLSLMLTAALAAATLVGCSALESAEPYTARLLDVQAGDQPAVELASPPVTDESRPAFLSATLLPGRGMDTHGLKAHFPGLGVVDVILTRPLEGESRGGNPAGGIIMIPFANRMRGKFIEGADAIELNIAGRPGRLPARAPRAGGSGESTMMHGLLRNRGLENVTLEANGEQATFKASLDAGDFGGYWFSTTHLDYVATLTQEAFGFAITATNTGSEPTPMAIGWHPYFGLPSGQRAQGRLHLTARRRAIVTSYQEMLPTGEAPLIEGTEYGFNAPGGAPLGERAYDDCFFDFVRNADGSTVAEVIDPAAKYGLRITAVSPEIKAMMVYSREGAPWVAVEPQFNLSDPYHSNWGNQDTGMVTLKPGESVTYQVKLELFQP